MSRSYWKERERQKQARMDKVTDEQLKRFRELLLASLDDLDKQIQKIYMKYAKDNNLDYHDALQYLTDDEKKEFQKDLQYYLEKAQNEQDRIQYKQELHALSVRHRVKRIEMLKANIQKHASILHNRLNTETREAISSLYPEGFLRGIYESVQGKDPDGVPLAEAINPSHVQEILETPWSGKNYSEKIWDLTADFEKKLSETLTQDLVQGKHPNEMARDFRKLGVGKEGTSGIVHRAETLMQTEAANILEQATLKGYAATKIDEYEFMTAKDGKVCGICADITKERFPCGKAITGTNYPPMHPRCRCTTVPVTPYSDEDPNEQYAYETDYDEWYDTYCAESVDDAYAQWAKENGVDLDEENEGDLENMSSLLFGKIRSDKTGIKFAGDFKVTKKFEYAMPQEWIKELEFSSKNAVPEVKSFYEKYKSKIGIKNNHFIHPSQNEHYSPKAKGIRWNIDDLDVRTAWHEIGHNLDHLTLFPSKAQSFIDALDSDMNVFVAQTKNMLKKQSNNVVTDKYAFQYLADFIKCKGDETDAPLSDIFSAYGYKYGVKFKWFHEDDYWQKKHSLAKESFAHFFAASMMNNETLEKIQSTFPKAYKEFIMLIQRR